MADKCNLVTGQHVPGSMAEQQCPVHGGARRGARTIAGAAPTSAAQAASAAGEIPGLRPETQSRLIRTYTGGGGRADEGVALLRDLMSSHDGYNLQSALVYNGFCSNERSAEAVVDRYRAERAKTALAPGERRSVQARHLEPGLHFPDGEISTDEWIESVRNDGQFVYVETDASTAEGAGPYRFAMDDLVLARRPS